MALGVFRVFSIVDGRIVDDGPRPPKAANHQPSSVLAVLTNLPGRGSERDPVPEWEWEVSITIGQGARARLVAVPIQVFLTGSEHSDSLAEPFCFSRLCVTVTAPITDPGLTWLWLYRNSIYTTERTPMPSEMAEVVLRIKSSHYQRDEELRRLREQVANFEAIEQTAKDTQLRKQIPDDVKMLVWSRDGGACVGCRSTTSLHFDHIIPVAKGGSDVAENIQILCRTCNLAKGDRLI